MAKLKSVPTKATNSKSRQEAAFQAGMAHLDEMWEPMYRLEGLLKVLCHMDPERESPDPRPLIETFETLEEITDTIKGHYHKACHHFDVFTGDAERAAKRKQQELAQQLKELKGA